MSVLGTGRERKKYASLSLSVCVCLTNFFISVKCVAGIRAPQTLLKNAAMQAKRVYFSEIEN